MASRISPSSSSSSSTVSSGDPSLITSCGYVEHKVSKLDTLAGVAIKYGAEVADVKRMNGLLTDSQMFALPTLRIPLPGRHPPSAALSHDEAIPRYDEFHNLPRSNTHSPFMSNVPRSKRAPRSSEKKVVTSAMGLLRGYYGLASPSTKVTREGMEMAVYKSDGEGHSEDEPFSPPVPDLPDRKLWSWSDGPMTTQLESNSFDNGSTSPMKQELFAVESTAFLSGHHRRQSRERLESLGTLVKEPTDSLPGHLKRPSRERLESSNLFTVESTAILPGHQRRPSRDKLESALESSLLPGQRRLSRDRIDLPGNLGDVIDGDRSIERPVRRRAKGEGISSTADSPLEATDRQDVAAVEKMISPARTPAPTRGLGPRVKDSENLGSLSRSSISSSANGGHSTGEVLFGQGGSGGKGLGSSLLGGNAVENLLSKIRRTASATLLQEDRFSFITPTRNRGDPSGTPLAVQPSSHSGSRSSVLEGLVKPNSSRRNKTALD